MSRFTQTPICFLSYRNQAKISYSQIILHQRKIKIRVIESIRKFAVDGVPSWRIVRVQRAEFLAPFNFTFHPRCCSVFPPSELLPPVPDIHGISFIPLLFTLSVSPSYLLPLNAPLAPIIIIYISTLQLLSSDLIRCSRCNFSPRFSNNYM